MRALVSVLGALFACAPGSSHVLPEAPPGAKAVALLSGDPLDGWLAPLPLAEMVVLGGRAFEAHFYGEDLVAARTRVVKAEPCASHGLPTPLTSWIIDDDGARATQPQFLAAPELPCADTPTVSVAPIEAVGACRRPAVTARSCALEVDFSSCGPGPISAWPVMLDGTVCGPSTKDELCSQIEVPAGALAGGKCGDYGYALYEHVDLPTRIERVDLSAHAVFPRAVVDLAPLDGAVAVAIGSASNTYECYAPDETTILIYDLGAKTLAATATAPPCLTAMTPAPGGGFFAAYKDGDRLGLGEFDARGARVKSATLADAPDYLTDRILLPRVVAIVDTTVDGGPREITLAFTRERYPEPDHFTLVRISAETLEVVVTRELEGLARDVVLDRATGELVISDDVSNTLRFFEVPITRDGVEVAQLTSFQPSVKMGPIIAAGDRDLWLAGRASETTAVDVFTGRGVLLAPKIVEVFVRDPLASNDALHRIDTTHVLGLFHRQDDGSDASLPLWATMFDITDPDGIAIGPIATEIGRERAFRSKSAADGSVWVALPIARELVRLVPE